MFTRWSTRAGTDIWPPTTTERRRRDHQPPGGVNWLSVSSAPCGSRVSAVLVHSMSSDEITTAPSLSAVAVDSSRDREGDVPVIMATSQRHHPADGVGEAGRGGDALLSFVDSRVDGGGEMVAVAGRRIIVAKPMSSNSQPKSGA